MMARVAKAHRAATYEVPHVPSLVCAERLAICLEGGDVSDERARQMAEEDAAVQRCGRMCTCRES